MHWNSPATQQEFALILMRSFSVCALVVYCMQGLRQRIIGVTVYSTVGMLGNMVAVAASFHCRCKHGMWPEIVCY